MKILLIDVNCKHGSTGKIVYELYSKIRESGNSAKICYGRGPLVKEPDIVKFSSEPEMFIHAFLSRITGLNGYFSPFATKRLLKEIQTYQPDVVHIHDPKTYYMNIGPLIHYLAQAHIPVVWTFHSEFMYTGKCGYANECLQWQTHCMKCPQLHTYPKSLFFDRTFQMFGDKQKWFSQLSELHIVSPSRWLADRVISSFLKDRRISVIPNGINTDIFHRRDCSKWKEREFKNQKVILSLAPDIMNERKGGKWILQLAEKMKDRKDLHFILIGCNEPTDSIPHSNNVTLLPPIYDQCSLAEYYSLADVFLICSYRENFPTTCLEAQCCGAPVAGFDTGGTAETAVNEKSMRLVSHGDLEALAEEVDFYLARFEESDHTDLAEEAQKKYSVDAMFNHYFAIYEEILS